MGWRGRIVRTRKEMLYEPSSQLREGFLTVKMIVFQRLWRGLGNKKLTMMRENQRQRGQEAYNRYGEPVSRRSFTWILGRHVSREEPGAQNVRGWTSWTWTVVFKVERNYNAICCVAQGQIHHPVNSNFFFFKSNTKGSHHWPLNGPFSPSSYTENDSVGNARRDREETLVQIWCAFAGVPKWTVATHYDTYKESCICTKEIHRSAKYVTRTVSKWLGSAWLKSNFIPFSFSNAT